MTEPRNVLRTALIAGASLLAMSGVAQAQTTASPADQQARIEALEAQLQALAAQIADLKTTTAAGIKEVRAAQGATTVSLANGRPTISTGDGAFSVAVRGIFQADAAYYDQASAGPLASDRRRGSFNDAAENDRARDLSDGVNIRRARLGVEGKLFGAFDYNMIYDFGGSGAEEAGKISSAWLQYSGYPVKLRAGVYARSPAWRTPPTTPARCSPSAPPSPRPCAAWPAAMVARRSACSPTAPAGTPPCP
ncbi:porin [Caulobacter sp. B11]|uniref:porin n=1 Tax=Caulobacter sp. B11 TaxID=2048899 RepID=UPI0021008580|nr:porin [Caulobacter sp. B11]